MKRADPTQRRVLITGAGSGPGNNLIRSLRTGDSSLFIVGCHADRFVLKQCSADRKYLIPSLEHPAFLEGLGRVIEGEHIDLLIPTSDADVRVLSRGRERIPCRLFLPKHAVITLCQDKFELTAVLRARGVPVPVTYPVTDLERIEELFQRLGSPAGAWCRLRAGQGAMGAILVKSPEQARRWLQLWEEARGVPPTSFTLSEYLPGRDFACQTLWNDGTLVLLKIYERLSYLGAGSRTGGLSLAALSKTVCDRRLAQVCTEAIRAVDAEASGVFVLDLKENVSGVPCVTEINAGRFGMSTNIFDLTGKYNMAVTYTRLAVGEPVEISEPYDVAEDYYMVRDFDTIPGIYHADELFDGIEEARV